MALPFAVLKVATNCYSSARRPAIAQCWRRLRQAGVRFVIGRRHILAGRGRCVQRPAYRQTDSQLAQVVVTRRFDQLDVGSLAQFGMDEFAL